MPASTLVSQAQLVALQGPIGTRTADVRFSAAGIEAIGRLAARPGETVIDAAGNALVPGLHDHHLHFLSFAASLASVRCGPPEVQCAEELAAALTAAPGDGWLRGYGYHESVAGDIDRDWLDRHAPARPIRIQHRTGRMWIMNSPALALVRASAKENLTAEQRGMVDITDGRLYDADVLLRELVPTDLSMVREASRRLAERGVTAFNDMTPANSPATFDLFRRLRAEGGLTQDVVLSGTAALSSLTGCDGLRIGATKVHLHESALPDFDALCAIIDESHRDGRGVAVHCVTETELVFALAAFARAGSENGDRIEHASVAPDALVAQLAALRLPVVTQPGFVFERGDAYLRDIPTSEHGNLYRARTLADMGIGVAFATDAPFSHADPWQAMRAATTRLTAAGSTLGSAERVTPEFALAAFLGPLDAPTEPRAIAAGCAADLCLLDRPWRKAREDLGAVRVVRTFRHGTPIHTVT